MRRDKLLHVRAYFDGPWYAATYGSRRWRVRWSPWKYYRRRGRWKHHSPRQLFAAAWYLARYPDVRAAGLDPLAHYLAHGWHEGRQPHPLFAPAWYLALHADVQAAGTEPLLHYVTHGWREGRSPHPAFDAPGYLAAHPDVAAARVEPLGHYLDRGWRLGYRPHPCFDPARYLAGNADVARAGLEPFTHFIDAGWREGREPFPDFSLLGPAAADTGGEPVVASTGTCGLPSGDANRQTAGPRIHPVAAPAADSHPTISNAAGPVNRGHVRGLALYLPRFHRLPEDDAPAGESRIEWNNVCRARPMFAGHRQPHLPHPDLGFYDLDDPEVYEQQVELARRAGIHGFCFFHSRLEGRPLRSQLVARLLASRGPDFPFCLCWDPGAGNRPSAASPGEERFVREVVPALQDPRSITVDGKPLLVVARPGLLADPTALADRCRRVAEREGLPGLHLAACEASVQVDPRAYGFDAAIDVPPRSIAANLRRPGLGDFEPGFHGAIHDYREAVCHSLGRATASYPLYRGVMTGWDDTPRRLGRATVWIHSSPELYGRWLRAVVEKTQREQPPARQLVFLNAWNDWARGAHLEPDCHSGYRHLEETAAVLLPRAAEIPAGRVRRAAGPAQESAVGRAA